jgi:hypothetical protein
VVVSRITRLVATRRSRDYWATRDAGDVEAITAWFGDLDPPALHVLVASLENVPARADEHGDG